MSSNLTSTKNLKIPPGKIHCEEEEEEGEKEAKEEPYKRANMYIYSVVKIHKI